MRNVGLTEARPEIINGALNDLAHGRLENGGVVTLTANAATTTVSHVGIAVGDYIGLMPITANAAAALPTTYILAANVTKNQFVISHANNAQADKTFRFVFFATQTARAH